MGLVYVRATVSNPAEPEKKAGVGLLVDTRAIFTAIPREILEGLGLKPVGRRKLRIFGGQVVERDVGGALITYGEASAVVPVIFGEKGDTSVMGATTLEALGYQVDPVTKQLKPVELLMI